jgi:hypothetical protein
VVVLSHGDRICFRSRQSGVVTGSKYAHTVRKVSLVFCRGYGARFRLGELGVVAGYRSAFAGGEIPIMVRRLCYRNNLPQAQAEYYQPKRFLHNCPQLLQSQSPRHENARSDRL